jgi:hypothetical protein
MSGSTAGHNPCGIRGSDVVDAGARERHLRDGRSVPRRFALIEDGLGELAASVPIYLWCRWLG